VRVYREGRAGYTLAGLLAGPVHWNCIHRSHAICLRSKIGTGLAAIRDNDRTAASCGINVFNLKLCSFVIAAFVTGIAGAIFYIYQGYIEPGSAFSVQWLITLMLATS